PAAAARASSSSRAATSGRSTRRSCCRSCSPRWTRSPPSGRRPARGCRRRSEPAPGGSGEGRSLRGSPFFVRAGQTATTLTRLSARPPPVHPPPHPARQLAQVEQLRPPRLRDAAGEGGLRRLARLPQPLRQPLALAPVGGGAGARLDELHPLADRLVDVGIGG